LSIVFSYKITKGSILWSYTRKAQKPARKVSGNLRRCKDAFLSEKFAGSSISVWLKQVSSLSVRQAAAGLESNRKNFLVF
jgi:hypothetical protein